MNHVSLFSGIGGTDLAAEWAGFETVLQVEIDDYANRVLEKHWPNVKRIRDIRDVNRESISGAVTVISGGFPCQPHSLAGKRRSANDERYLWPEMYRVIRVFRPAWAIVENVPGILSDGTAGQVQSDLEKIGFEVLPIDSYASTFGASFQGRRIFIVATSKSGGHRRGSSEKCGTNKRLVVEEKQKRCETWGEAERCLVDAIRSAEAIPEYLRGDYGLPDWTHRLKCLGNAVVPQQAYPIFKAIAEIENAE